MVFVFPLTSGYSAVAHSEIVSATLSALFFSFPRSTLVTFNDFKKGHLCQMMRVMVLLTQSDLYYLLIFEFFCSIKFPCM